MPLMDRREGEMPRKGPPEEDWKKSVDFSHLDNDELCDRVIKVLEDHREVFVGKLGEIRAAEHRIKLAPGTEPMRQAT